MVKERNIPITPEFRTTLINSSLEEFKRSVPIAYAYTPDAILTNNESSQKAIRNYGTQVANIIVSNTPKGAKNEYMTMVYALHREEYSELKKLIPIVEGYQKIRDDLLKLRVPNTVAKEHLHFLNSAHALQHVIGLMALYESDPAVSLLALEQYQNIANRLRLSFEKMDDLFDRNNITYSQSENASMFSI